MEMLPEYEVTALGAKRTVTVCEEPGASEKEPPPLMIEKPEALTETLPDRVPEELEALEIVKLSSLVWPTFTVPNRIEFLLNAISMV
jgi:hypothetical protein